MDRAVFLCFSSTTIILLKDTTNSVLDCLFLTALLCVWFSITSPLVPAEKLNHKNTSQICVFMFNRGFSNFLVIVALKYSTGDYFQCLISLHEWMSPDTWSGLFVLGLDWIIFQYDIGNFSLICMVCVLQVEAQCPVGSRKSLMDEIKPKLAKEKLLKTLNDSGNIE